DQLKSQLAAYRVGRTRKCTERHRFVVGIEQAIELRAARLHALGEFALADAFVLHHGIELPGEHALDRSRGYLSVDAIFLEEIVEGRSNPSGFLHARLFFLFKASVRSDGGLFCVFLMKPWSRTIRPR